MNILYILHAAFELPAAIETWAQKKQFQSTTVRPFLGEPLPNSSYDLIIVMGGPQSSVELEKYPYLKEEIHFLAEALQAHRPVLGFCLGAQLIGEALGAPAMRSPHKEVGVFPIELTSQGRVDPLFAHLPQQFLVGHWHQDMPGLTKDSQILAKSAGCPRQIVRYASHALGFQCHPEMTRQSVDLLIQNCPEDLSKGPFIQLPELFLAQDFDAMNQNLYRILDNFWSVACKRGLCFN